MSNRTDITKKEEAEETVAKAAGARNKSFVPYYARYYTPPEQVLDLYPDPDVTYTTPGFQEGKETFTSQEEMIAFLEDLNETTPHMSMEILGQSHEGRDILMLVFTMSKNIESDDFKEKPTVWLQAEVHGNEPAAGESVLVIAQKLAKDQFGKDVLKKINVVIIPQMNPDSSYYFERLTTTGLNGNRDHINLDMPELQLIHSAFNRFKPEVVIDAHEYGAMPTFNELGEEGGLKYHDVLLLAGKNLNIPQSIRDNSDDWFVDSAFAELEKKGLSYSHYYTATSPKDEQPILREGGVNAGTGRNAFALKPSFSILVETLGIGIGRDTFLRRVTGQVTTHQSIIETTASRAKEVKEVIQEARESIANGGNKGKDNDSIVIQSKAKEVKGKKVPVVDIAKGEVIEIPVTYYSSTQSEATLERMRPTAYLMPPSYHHIAKKLQHQGVKVEKLKEDQQLTVECYEVTERDVSNKAAYPTSSVQTKRVEKNIFFPAESYVFHSAQATAYLLSLALEPESEDSYVTYNYLPVGIGDEVPVYRYMNKAKLSTIDVS